jgi:hypothetical protein
MPLRRQTFLRWTRALLTCLVVFLAFEPPAPRVELSTEVVAALTVGPAVRASVVRRVESRRAPQEPLLSASDALRPISRSAAPHEPLHAARRLYVELCSLLC